MQTRRQWLAANPRPKSPVNLQALLEQEQRRLAAKEGNLAEVQNNISVLTNEITLAAKCPLHQRGLHYHKNRPEDLFICEIGPHFFFWTQVASKPQLLPVASLALPGLDFPMTDGTAISEQEQPKKVSA